MTNHGDRASRAPPRTDLLHELARIKNQQALPTIKPFSGPRIPPDRYWLVVGFDFSFKIIFSLSGVNFRAKEASADSGSRNESFEDGTMQSEPMDLDGKNWVMD